MKIKTLKVNSTSTVVLDKKTLNVDSLEVSSLISDEDTIKEIRILLICEDTIEEQEKEKRYIKALGGYSEEQRIIRYFLSFFFISFVSISIFLYLSMFPEHIYKDLGVLSFLLLTIPISVCVGIFGLLFNSIFTICRLIHFNVSERKIEKAKNND